MKKLILIFFMSFLFCFPTYAAVIDIPTDYGRFKFDDTTGTITTYIGNDANINIPEIINGVPVTKIAFGAFQGNSSIKTIIIPATIIEIRSQAFHDCTSLTAIYFKGNAPTIGDNIFYGVNKNYKTYITKNTSGFSAPTWASMAIEVINFNTYQMSTATSNDTLNVQVANTPFIDGATIICGIYSEKKLIKSLFSTISKNTNNYNFDILGVSKPFTAKTILIHNFSNLKPLTQNTSTIIN